MLNHKYITLFQKFIIDFYIIIQFYLIEKIIKKFKKEVDKSKEINKINK
jgi:hypothetical protein